MRPNRNQGQEHTGARTRSQGFKDQVIDTQGVKRGIQELKGLGLNVQSRTSESNTNEEQEEDQARQADHNDDQVQPDRVAKAIEAHVLIDRLQEDAG